MRSRFLQARYLVPLVAGGLAVVFLLPGGDAQTSSQQTSALSATAPARVNGPETAPIAVARVGTPALAPIPLAETFPEAPTTTAVPNAAAASAAPPVETTAPIPEQPAPKPVADGEPSFVGNRAVNLRAGPSKDTASLAVLKPGDALQIIEESEGWTYVATAAGDTGWVSSPFIGASAPAPKAAATAPKTDERPANVGNAIRANGPITVRSGASALSERVFTIQPGETSASPKPRRLGRVVPDNGISGWIRVRRGVKPI